MRHERCRDVARASGGWEAFTRIRNLLLEEGPACASVELAEGGLVSCIRDQVEGFELGGPPRGGIGRAVGDDVSTVGVPQLRDGIEAFEPELERRDGILSLVGRERLR